MLGAKATIRWFFILGRRTLAVFMPLFIFQIIYIVLRSTLGWFRVNYIDFRRMITIERKSEQMEYVLCDLDGSKISSFRGGFKKSLARAGINDITIHTLRHTFASHLANSGTPLLTIKDLLGHTDIKTTTIYAHLSNEHLQNAVRLMDYGLKFGMTQV